MRRFGKTIDGKAAARHGVFQADAVLVGAAAVGFDARSARECRRSQQAASEARAFFVGPIHKTHRDRRAAVEFFRETPQHLQARQEVQASVQPSAVRDRIEMATDDQRFLRCAWQRGPAISRRVVVVFHGKALILD